MSVWDDIKSKLSGDDSKSNDRNDDKEMDEEYEPESSDGNSKGKRNKYRGKDDEDDGDGQEQDDNKTKIENDRRSELEDQFVKGGNLERENLSSMEMEDLDLRDCHMADADMRNAKLSNSDLRGADLSGAQLQGANLRGAKLDGANLSGTQLYHDDLRDYYKKPESAYQDWLKQNANDGLELGPTRTEVLEDIGKYLEKKQVDFDSGDGTDNEKGIPRNIVSKRDITIYGPMPDESTEKPPDKKKFNILTLKKDEPKVKVEKRQKDDRPAYIKQKWFSDAPNAPKPFGNTEGGGDNTRMLQSNTRPRRRSRSRGQDNGKKGYMGGVTITI